MEDEEDEREQARAQPSTDKSITGTKRKSEADDADSVRLQDRETTDQRGMIIDTAKPAETTGSKRKADDEQIDESRTKDTGNDMSSVTASHPGQIHFGGKYEKGDP